MRLFFWLKKKDIFKFSWDDLRFELMSSILISLKDFIAKPLSLKYIAELWEIADYHLISIKMKQTPKQCTTCIERRGLEVF